MRIVSLKSGRLITWSGNQSKKQQQVASVHNTGDCIELTKSRPWRWRKNLVNCDRPTCPGLHQARGHPHPPPSWCRPYKQLCPTHWSTDQTIRDWGSSNSQNYPPLLVGAKWRSPPLNEEKGIWWEQILSLLRRLPLIPTLDHDLPTPSHSSLELNLLFDDLCKRLRRSNVPRIIHYTSSASTYICQKNSGTAYFETKNYAKKCIFRDICWFVTKVGRWSEMELMFTV